MVWNGYIFGSEEIYNPSLAIYQGKLLRVVNVEIYQQRNRTTYSGNSDAGILRVFVHGICACVRVCVCVCVCDARSCAQMSQYALNIPPRLPPTLGTVIDETVLVGETDPIPMAFDEFASFNRQFQSPTRQLAGIN